MQRRAASRRRRLIPFPRVKRLSESSPTNARAVTRSREIHPSPGSTSEPRPRRRMPVSWTERLGEPGKSEMAFRRGVTTAADMLATSSAPRGCGSCQIVQPPQDVRWPSDRSTSVPFAQGSLAALYGLDSCARSSFSARSQSSMSRPECGPSPRRYRTRGAESRFVVNLYPWSKVQSFQSRRSIAPTTFQDTCHDSFRSPPWFGPAGESDGTRGRTQERQPLRRDHDRHQLRGANRPDARTHRRLSGDRRVGAGIPLTTRRPRAGLSRSNSNFTILFLNPY